MTDLVKAVPKPADISKFVMETGFDSIKFLAPAMIGGAVLGKPGVVLGAIAGTHLMKNKAVAGAYLGLVALDLIGEVFFGKDIIGAF